MFECNKIAEFTTWPHIKLRMVVTRNQKKHNYNEQLTKWQVGDIQ